MHVKLLLSSFVALLLIATTAGCGEPLVNKSFFGDVAVDGYDVVAYFTEEQPVKGRKEFSVEHNGAVYRFASAEHRDLFQMDPGKYLPAYGGFCAWAVAHGDTAGIDPKVWTIHEGRLFLNYNPQIQKDWEMDMTGYIAKGDANWPKIVDEKTR